ncbi:cupin domain-containing protein [Saccharibacter sp. 17.LH.SD]|uniref:cupin domain-containing protein n=1 Tax=Saccharibacter sp. 17.LH.SD TaxID=2689393 RepID=UPI00136CE4F9|nr:cupin domain-containing protein [Saccharibacter sp. 17.LH.SD]MXV45168.1 cupin domain-containing protein [Saccharibacter sp. 17.LH.SD]
MTKQERYGGRFDLNEVMKRFPETAPTMIMDEYVTDSKQVSTRVFRVYRSVPPHYHTQCDEVLYVMSGRGTFWIDDPMNESVFEPGHMIVFPRQAVHAIPSVLEEPVIFLAIDTPRRDPEDVIFINPEDGDPRRFIRQIDAEKRSEG